MKVALYARVSSELQEKERTIESQLQALRNNCKDFEVEEYVDDGWSGETLARPSLDKLRDDAKKEKFKEVYVFSPDRFSRNLVNGIILKQELEKLDIKVNFLNKDYGNDIDGDFYYKLDQLIAEKEKQTILERFRRGKLAKARMGMVVGTYCPYGYDYVKKTVEKKGYYKINKKEAECVKEIFNLYLQKGSILSVVRELNKKGIYKPRKSNIWRVSTVHNMLHNKSYTGITYFNKTKSVEPQKRIKENGRYLKRPKTSNIKRNKDEWISIKIPAIINKNLFLLVQKKMEKRNRPYGVRKYDYLLSGIIKCSCGGVYNGNRCQKIAYYRCSNRRGYPYTLKKCSAKLIRAEKIEIAVWKKISEIMQNPKILFNFVGFLINKVNRVDSIKKEVKSLEDLIGKEKEKKERLIELYQEGDIDKNEYRGRVVRLDKAITELDRSIDDKNEFLKQIENIPNNKDFLISFIGRIKNRIDKFTFEQKKIFLENILEKITYNQENGKAVVFGEIPVIDISNSVSSLWTNSNESLYRGRVFS